MEREWEGMRSERGTGKDGMGRGKGEEGMGRGARVGGKEGKERGMGRRERVISRFELWPT
jgi:hypothetical protein